MALPPEIIEIILGKLSGKPLLRFKSVCKSWNTIISNPVIIRNHHHRQLSNDPNNLFLLQNSRVSSDGFSLVKLEAGRKIQTLQPIFGPILVTDISYERMALWNPSTRTHTNLQPQFYYSHDSAFGICRDPITDDLKVVVVNCYSYSVYSCKNKSWIIADEDYDEENEDIGYVVANNNQNAGICVDGASYWVCDGLDDWDYDTKQIAYYDPRDNMFKILQKPKNVDDSKSIYLVDLRGSIYGYSGFSFKEFKDIEVFHLGLVPYMDTLFFPIEKSLQIVTGPFGFPIEKPRPKRKRKLKCLQ